jgi:RecB family endonuclease NucS
MPLFAVEQGGLKPIQTQSFTDEAALQKLFDDNLEVITGVRLIESQYPIPNGRIDSLGIDEQNVPVVIEYKWSHDPGAIIQGLSYLQWVTQNRRSFELLVKESLEIQKSIGPLHQGY